MDKDVTPEDMAGVVMTCWLSQVTTKSDYARAEADKIAAAVSEGFLTTRVGEGEYARLWLPTPVGLEFLSETYASVEF